ncbi:addiction module protein [Oceanospirillum beijerinckii]|uniref:addiction module protein n=1 Tax=Oceanospirillum beijerinckii TaxID=64976 RepID=UPI0004005A93|nr:addiction module protein [Oceanospirillum beijerinckii]
MNLKAIETEALQLSEKDRAELVRKLVLSLDQPSDAELENDWLDEAERRAKQLDSGEVRGVPAEEFLKKARALLKQG